jgi:hypothetical protein
VIAVIAEHLKHDLHALLNILGLERHGNHCACVFCSSDNAMSVFQGDDAWAFKCHSCGAAGDLITAVALIERCTRAEAFERLGIAINRPIATIRARPDPAPPVPDRDRVQQLFEKALATVLEGRADRWLAKRGITAEFIGRHAILGFVERVAITDWKWQLVNAWIIRICTPNGDCVALKGHREDPPPKISKSCWLPFGTTPADKPRHGFATLWPPPEWPLAESEWLYLCPGELKAAAVLSAGRAATSITTGESFRWTPGAVQRLAGRRVCVVFDDDEAGHRFRDNTLKALAGHAADLKAITFGKEGNE